MCPYVPVVVSILGLAGAVGMGDMDDLIFAYWDDMNADRVGELLHQGLGMAGTCIHRLTSNGAQKKSSASSSSHDL